MAGLRERKKIARRAELLKAATDLFRSAGYEHTTMEEIARRADVSPPTLYSYFPTKQDLLLALFREGRNELRNAYDAILDNPPEDPVEAVTRLIHVDMGDIRSVGDKKCWREILAAWVRAHDRADDAFHDHQLSFEIYLRRLLDRLIEAGRLSDALDTTAASEVLYAVTWNMFWRLVSDERATPESTRAWIERQVQLVLAGWLVVAMRIEKKNRSCRIPRKKGRLPSRTQRRLPAFRTTDA